MPWFYHSTTLNGLWRKIPISQVAVEDSLMRGRHYTYTLRVGIIVLSLLVMIAVSVVILVGIIQGWLFNTDRRGVLAFMCFGGSLGMANMLSMLSERISVSYSIRVNLVGAIVGGALFVPYVLQTAPVWWFLINIFLLPLLLGFSAKKILLNNPPHSGSIIVGLTGIWLGITTTVGWLMPWPLWAKLALAIVFPLYIWHSAVTVRSVLAIEGSLAGEISWRLVFLGLLVSLGWSIAEKNWWILGIALATVFGFIEAQEIEEAKRREKERDRDQFKLQKMLIEKLEREERESLVEGEISDEDSI